MSKYGYISLDMLYEYAMNTVDKTVSPNEFMRMSRANVIPIEWIKSWAMKWGYSPKDPCIGQRITILAGFRGIPLITANGRTAIFTVPLNRKR